MKKEIFCIFKHQKPKKHLSCIDAKNQKSQIKQIFEITKKLKKEKVSKWTKEEDEILLNLGQNAKRNKWKKCSLMLTNKTSFQCYLRYKQINPNIKKGRWTVSEDKQLLELVGIFGKSWSSIAKIMKQRSNKQIRNRYEEQISESLNKGLFTEEEDEKLILLFKIIQKNWFEYKKYFKDRSIKRLKSRIIYLINRKRVIHINKNAEKKRVSISTEKAFSNQQNLNMLMDNNYITAGDSSKNTISSEDCANKGNIENCRSSNSFNYKSNLIFVYY